MVITLKNILIICLITYLCLISNQQAFAQFNDGGVFNKGTLVSETDGSPSVKAKEIIFENTLVTDNSNGTVTINDRNVTIPSVSTDTCVLGQYAAETGWLYACVDTNSWERVALSTWVGVPSYLLLEIGDFILLETGDKILLE